MPVKPQRLGQQAKQRSSAGQYSHLYTTRKWRAFRADFLRRNPLCVMCQEQGRITVATIVDHIRPHKGDMALFWSGPFQALCKKCHDYKTLHEDGGAEYGHASLMPSWLKASDKLIVVCGPPAAGKTTYVEQNALPNDMVIDLDKMSLDILGIPLLHTTPEQRDGLIRKRNSLLSLFANGKTRHPKCWLIVTAGTFKQRKYWREKSGQLVVLDVDKYECKKRIEQRGITDAEKRQLVEAVDRWG